MLAAGFGWKFQGSRVAAHQMVSNSRRDHLELILDLVAAQLTGAIAGTSGIVATHGAAQPIVTTEAASDTTPTGFTAHGTLVRTGGAPCDARGVVYGWTSRANPGNVAPDACGYIKGVDEAGTFTPGAFTEAVTP